MLRPHASNSRVGCKSAAATSNHPTAGRVLGGKRARPTYCGTGYCPAMELIRLSSRSAADPA
jgi:hypothetical protein